MIRPREQKIINELVAVLRENGYPNLQVDAWPDEDKRGNGNIEAIAGPFAIEHTTIDGLPDQRGHDDRFRRIISGVAEDRQLAGDCQTTVVLGYDDILRISSRSVPSINAQLLVWLREVLSRLSEGEHRFPPTADIPISILIRKRCGWGPGISFRRDLPSASAVSEKLRGQLERKARKLRRYKSESCCTLLLVELDCSPFMGADDFIRFFCSIYENRSIEGIDELWFAETRLGEFWKLGEVLAGPFHIPGRSGACNSAPQADG